MNFLDELRAQEAAHKVIMRQPLGSKLQAYSQKLHDIFEEGLETVCTFKGDYYQPPEYDYAPGEQARLDEWNEASDIIEHYLHAMCHRLSLAGLDTCDIMETLNESGEEHWLEIILASLADHREGSAELKRYMNSLTMKPENSNSAVDMVNNFLQGFAKSQCAVAAPAQARVFPMDRARQLIAQRQPQNPEAV